MRGRYGTTKWRRMRIHANDCLPPVRPVRPLVLHCVDRFGTIKKLPTRLAPHREAGTANDYPNNDAIQDAIASSVRTSSIRPDSLKKNFFFIRRLLSYVESGANPLRLAPVSVFALENMQPTREAPPVYMEVA
jgi:hypothetical protein